MKRYGAVTLLKISFLFNEIFLSTEDLVQRPFLFSHKKYSVEDFLVIYLSCFSKPMVNFEHGDSVRPECIPGVELAQCSEPARG